LVPDEFSNISGPFRSLGLPIPMVGAAGNDCGSIGPRGWGRIICYRVDTLTRG
jgi:hypothetical protein